MSDSAAATDVWRLVQRAETVAREMRSLAVELDCLRQAAAYHAELIHLLTGTSGERKRAMVMAQGERADMDQMQRMAGGGASRAEREVGGEETTGTD